MTYICPHVNQFLKHGDSVFRVHRMAPNRIYLMGISGPHSMEELVAEGDVSP